MHNLKTVVAGIALLLAIVVILQNVEPVDTRILFVTLTMPRAFLLFGTFILGFVVGALWTTVKLARRER